MNLQQDTDKTYDACPYCLTEISIKDEPNANFDEPENLTPEISEPETFDSVEPEAEETEAAAHKEEVKEVADTPSECTHYLGYLSEKGSKADIPDECMMCKDIVTCMLKKMKT